MRLGVFAHKLHRSIDRSIATLSFPPPSNASVRTLPIRQSFSPQLGLGFPPPVSPDSISSRPLSRIRKFWDPQIQCFATYRGSPHRFLSRFCSPNRSGSLIVGSAMSFSRNCRGKRRSDAVDYHCRDPNANYGSGVWEDVGALPLKRKRLTFPKSGWECGPGDRFVIPGTVRRRWIGDSGFAHFTGDRTFPGQLLPVALPQRGDNSGDILRVKNPGPVSLAEEEDPVFMSRDEIDRCSPSRKDGIDAVRETRLRYSYCSFLQKLGLKLELPQTTIGTAMVLCHRFFVRRSHACHDRFLIATAAMFLATKSEETPCLLNNVLTAACEICYSQNLSFLPQFLPVDWFERYREQVIGAEHMILTTLNFELNVQHPYTSLTSALKKLGLSQSALVNLAWSLISEGIVPICAHVGDIVASGMMCCSCKEYFKTPEVEKVVCCGNTHV